MFLEFFDIMVGNWDILYGKYLRLVLVDFGMYVGILLLYIRLWFKGNLLM